MYIGGDYISMWNYDVDTWPEIACQLAGRNLTRMEEVGPRTIDYSGHVPAVLDRGLSVLRVASREPVAPVAERADQPRAPDPEW